MRGSGLYSPLEYEKQARSWEDFAEPYDWKAVAANLRRNLCFKTTDLLEDRLDADLRVLLIRFCIYMRKWKRAQRKRKHQRRIANGWKKKYKEEGQ